MQKVNRVFILLSKKTSISDDKLERNVYFANVANMEVINVLEPKMKHKLILNI